MKHSQLVERAAKWLRNSRHCHTVMTEVSSAGCPVIPDAIGWTVYGDSISVECKTTMLDFRGDSQKRIHLGNQMFYMCPPKLIHPSQVKEPFGLLYAHRTIVRKVKEAEPRPTFLQEELALVLAELRRIAEGWRKQGDSVGICHAVPHSEFEVMVLKKRIETALSTGRWEEWGERALRVASILEGEEG